ncbi:LptA/OstA family protein [Longimicrobium sp.]|uniref:LptA/OstA family protein n=1 Tax=Longimicrobium sp. TaxID=2029185 RepID=UPI002B632DF1|nr:LptA/OstA family protein [Longimicrobium sp.]HSU18035.1 LptA/OstA family protein [Longimicrobium sp.]
MRRILLALALFAVPSAGRAAAQNTCELVSQRGNWTAIGDPRNRVISAQGPLLVRCTNGEELRADSAVIYSAQNEVQLYRQVDYQDPGRSLTSDYATYNSQTGRLYATGSVVFTDKQKGSTLRGPELEYFRAMAGRPEAQSTATQRPHVTVVPKSNGSANRRNPMEIDADRVTSVGERYMTATGNVVINDNGTRSTAEEAYYDQVADHVELRRQAKVDNEKYHLSGDLITTDLQNGSVSRVVAQTNARLVSERLTVDGPLLRMFFERDLLQRMTSGQVPGSTTPGRSTAVSKGFRMEADSIEALLPDQRLRQVNAVGKARGESWDTIAVRSVVVDSGAAAGRTASVPTVPRSMTEPPTELDQKDVLTADTIVAFFRSDSARADSASRPARGDSVRLAGRPARPATAQGDTAKTEIERLLAIGDAHSLYRMRDDSAKAGQKKPGLNYLIGDRIDLTFKDGEVDVAHVRGLKQGVYLDPDTRTAQNDTSAAGRAARANGQTTARPGTVTGATRATTGTTGTMPAPSNTPPRSGSPPVNRPPASNPPATPAPSRDSPSAPLQPAGGRKP